MTKKVLYEVWVSNADYEMTPALRSEVDHLKTKHGWQDRDNGIFFVLEKDEAALLKTLGGGDPPSMPWFYPLS